MKNKIRRLGILFFSALFIMACEKKEGNNEPNASIITIEALYETPAAPNKYVPDAGAKVFVYYGIISMDVVDYNYRSGGVLEKGNTIISPNQVATIGTNGLAVIKPEYLDKKVLIIVESNYYAKRLAHSSYNSAFESINQKVMFKP